MPEFSKSWLSHWGQGQLSDKINLDVLYAFKCLAPVLIWTDVLERVRKASAWLAKIMADDTIYTYFIGFLSLTQGTDYVMGGILTEK